MFRNQYDTDATTFSPAGRLHQVEYAMEAVKQGSAAVGIRSKHNVVMVSLKRQASELASYQKKAFKIDEHMGITISGLVADARVLGKYMQDECLNHRYVYESAMPVGRLVTKVSDKSQKFTQKSEKRPYGVGLLVAGYDKTGPHLYQTQPSGNFYEYYAQSMGARSQGAKTYLEKVFESFPEAPLDELIKHALTALKGASQKSLNSKNVTIAYVGKEHNFTVLEDDAVRPYVVQVAGEGGDDDEDDDEDEEEKEKEKPKGKDRDQDEDTRTGTTKGSKTEDDAEMDDGA
jgi:20S proteasome subunit alpha 6